MYYLIHFVKYIDNSLIHVSISYSSKATLATTVSSRKNNPHNSEFKVKVSKW